MKHIATAAAVTTLLALAAGTAGAQSSVTLFGVIDNSLRSVDNSGVGSNSTLASGGNTTSRFGLRGEEDLGAGLKASFWLESGLDTGTGAAGADGALFNRRSTVSLTGNFGEIRLGRDLNPSSAFTYLFDPFGVVGIGGSTVTARFVKQTTFYRNDNAISYFLPNMGGVYGNVMVAPGENGLKTTTTTTPNLARKYAGGRLGYANGPIDVAVSYGSTETDLTGGKFKTTGIGGSYNFGVAKLISHYYLDELTAGTDAGKEKRFLLGVSVPVGAHEVRASYVRTDATGGTAAYNASDANKLALGYVRNLSKRTALYGTLARISNKGGATFAIAGGNANMAAGGKSTGYELGLRHSF
jgi:predicted porin